MNGLAHEQYWTENHEHPGDWQIAIQASPWARARQRLEQRGKFGVSIPDVMAELARASDAVDPHLQSEGTPSTRDSKSFSAVNCAAPALTPEDLAHSDTEPDRD